MTIEELRVIVRELHDDYLKRNFGERWITDPLVEKALTMIEPVFRERLNKFIGVKREEWKTLVLPKQSGGDMKPGYSNVCYGLRSALRRLWWELRGFEKEAVAIVDREKQKFACPHQTIDWRLFAESVIALLDKIGACYYIKRDLARYIGHPEGIRKGVLTKT